MTAEQGKPLAEARGEVDYSASFFDVAADLAPHAGGEIVPTADPARRILVVPEPLGVAAIVTPWNFPLAMIARKVAPALAVGCSVVVKPDAMTPAKRSLRDAQFDEAIARASAARRDDDVARL